MGDFASRMAEYQSAKYPDRIRWEYREERNYTIDQLNALGSEGWELVSTHCVEEGQRSRVSHEHGPAWNSTAFVCYILKRPKVES